MRQQCPKTCGYCDNTNGISTHNIDLYTHGTFSQVSSLLSTEKYTNSLNSNVPAIKKCSLRTKNVEEQ